MQQAFNNLARQDNDVMKSIALLTMIFLPATFISVCVLGFSSSPISDQVTGHLQHHVLQLQRRRGVGGVG
jgi:hypothetical protein